ncbi:hypothetical protein [Paenibacillus sp. IHBB 10380]|uniref:hypothetical protein n=1 Tax=Paenibacillus sp. IHBB 10380 TaxID=1566358 RepID=UPI0005CFCBCF|nr:hypothetical protein [Paenibacillus sp. IHBB 10380]AJS57484.1 hypothetical protein UB51_02125 [Paenibacillus sp. IHBB 10380]
MLENERYAEAMELLRFLLQCQGQEERHYEEWQALLEWLETAFPQYIHPAEGTDSDTDEDEPDEEEISRRNAHFKLAEDSLYADKLLRIVKEEPLSEQTMLALGQLAHLTGSNIDLALVEWLQTNKLHSLLQFRVLQTLHKRGMQGNIRFTRGQEEVDIDIETVPLNQAEFPLAIQQILDRVAQHTEVKEPTLYYFAQELWSQFVMSVFGTHDYQSMLIEEDLAMDIWAATLHQIVSESLTGNRNEEEIRAMYGITENIRFQFEQAYRTMKQFISTGSGE